MRLGPLSDPVTVFLDDRPVPAERGEPVAVSLIAAGHLVLARSPKFHRPRGPACLRGACDGCLARVDGVPNVMTCRAPADDGMRIETQNVVGARELDLLRVADWFFPEGLNHHELLAGVPGAERVVGALARRVAGLGRLPARPIAAAAGQRRATDVLVVGAGPSGMAASVQLASKGRRVEVIDDDITWGGSVRALPGVAARVWDPLVNAFGRAVRSGVVIRPRVSAIGIYGDDVLVIGPGNTEVLTARTLVLAPGAHDGVLAFEGNDLPGVMSARAGCRLLAHGVAPGRHAVVVAPTGSPGPYGHAYIKADPRAVLVHGRPVRAGGGSRVRHVTVATAETGARTENETQATALSAAQATSERRRFVCDALLVDAPRAPAYELCAQAGAELVREERGFVVKTAPDRSIRPGVFVVGEAVGTPLEPAAIEEEARAL